MSQYETVDRIRRSHRAARPNAAVNPAWANCHVDCGVLLAEIERLRAGLGQIRDGRIIQGMSPELFADRVLAGFAHNQNERQS